MDKRIEALKKAFENDDGVVEKAIEKVLEQRKAFYTLETEITITKTKNKMELSIDDIQGDSGLVDFITIITWALGKVLKENIDSDEMDTAIEIVIENLRDVLS